MDFFYDISPCAQGLLATVFTWSVTAAGAAVVLLFRRFDRKVLDAMLGFGAGVMIAASFWSLLSPAIDQCRQLGRSPWLMPAIGFAAGAALVLISDAVLARCPLKGMKGWCGGGDARRSLLLIMAVTLHNIPEGLAVGVAFGAAALGVEGCTVPTAMMLALGIGLQNFPEGAAVSLPLRREGASRMRAFLLGQASGMVEPLGGLLGVLAAMAMRSVLPLLLSFAAGAMIAVVCCELIPESVGQGKTLPTVGMTAGFIAMMVLDVALS